MVLCASRWRSTLWVFSPRKDGSDESSVSSDVYIKLNGYAFRFVLEEEDFVPDVDFIPLIWENHDDGHDDGANGDEDMPDRDASKRLKNVQAVDQNLASGSQVSATVPMQSTQRTVHTALLESSVVSVSEGMATHMHVPVVQESTDACIPMQDELGRVYRAHRCACNGCCKRLRCQRAGISSCARTTSAVADNRGSFCM